MSLFPAYAQKEESDQVMEQDSDGSPYPAMSPTMETHLLESDSEGEQRPPSAPVQPATNCDDYYEDNKFDCGNLRVSTLYYPGRPWYDVESSKILGLEKHPLSCKKKRKRQKRYYEAKMEVSSNTEAELAARTAAYQQMLIETPDDEQLWIQFIDLQECWCGWGAARAAAEAAAARLPRSTRVRARRHRAMRAALSTEQYFAALRDEIAAERSVCVRTELWVRLLEALASVGALSGPDALAAAASAALADTRHHAHAYPLILYAYGSYLQAGGLWEQLVLLLELVAAMSFVPAGFPPPTDRERDERVERQLQEYEDKVISSGLPVSAVWVRVERARAAAHWRPAASSPADPQRAPLPADVADLLLPLHNPDQTFLLIVQMLRLAKVPLLPGAHYVIASVSASGGEAARGAEALLPLVYAARRLPPSHPARPAAALARRLEQMLLDPPHYFTDDAGFLSWVNALWDASGAWVRGERRVALLCWRLRWLHALLLLLDTEDDCGAREARRIRESARALLKREADESPLPFAEFARIELRAAGAERAQRAAVAALRAALAHDHVTPPHHVIYVARVVCEVCGAQSAAARWALASAALGRAPPPDLAAPPPPDLELAALQRCEERCEELEQQFEEADIDEENPLDPCSALLPSEAEWTCARALLASPARRHQLYLREVARARGRIARNAREARYHEQSAEELAVTAGRRAPYYARALAACYPDNALLALLCGGAPLWAWDAAVSQDARLVALAAHGSDTAALARVLPPVLRALANDTAAEWCGVVSALRRATRRGGAGPLLWSARLEAEARAPRPRLKHALYAALDALPHDKWLCVRGGAWCGGEAAALADLLLERQLRLHALRDELAPLPAADDDPAAPQLNCPEDASAAISAQGQGT